MIDVLHANCFSHFCAINYTTVTQTLVTLPLATFGGLFEADIRFLRGVNGDLMTLDCNKRDGVVAVELAVEFI